MVGEETTQIPITPPPAGGRPRPPSLASPTAKKRPADGKKKGKKIANSLVALSSAAILSVYGIGYVRTQSAAEQFTTASAADNATVAVATAAPTATVAPTATTVPSSSSIRFPFLNPSTGNAAPSAQSGGQVTPTATTASPTTAAPTTTVTAPKATTSVAASTTKSQYKDGTYVGTGTSRHGSIQATVIVQGGKIVSADITQCGTRYPCSEVSSLPKQVVAQQSAPVDFVSGATDSSTAYQGAVKNALAKASAG